MCMERGMETNGRIGTLVRLYTETNGGIGEMLHLRLLLLLIDKDCDCIEEQFPCILYSIIRFTKKNSF